MSKQFYSVEEIQDYFYNLLVNISSVKKENIFISNSFDSIPALKKSEDYIFLDISQEDDSIMNVMNRFKEYNYTNNNFDVVNQFTRVIRLFLIIYGNNSLKIATEIFYKLLTFEVQTDLKINNFRIIPDMTRKPNLMHDLLNTNWISRSDCSFYFYNIVESEFKENNFEIANIVIKEDK
jgi:hypothetical protein